MYSYSLRIFFAFALSAVLASNVCAKAGGLDDPTRPPGKRAQSSAGKQKSSHWRLASTLISPERRSAIINGRRVSVGDRVSGARVMEIHPAWVKLKTSKGVIQLSLSSPKVMKKIVNVNAQVKAQINEQ